MAQVESELAEPLSVEEYLRLAEMSQVRHEYVGGEIHALPGASDRHNRIAMNIAAGLWNAARGSACRVYGSDMLLRVAEDVFYYPDVQVVCDPTDTEEMFKSRPCVVVEVLAPSTEATDLREKLLAYRRLETLQAYVVVYRDRVRVQRYWRDEQGTWHHADLVGPGQVPFSCPEVTLSTAEIYEGLDTGAPLA